MEKDQWTEWFVRFIQSCWRFFIVVRFTWSHIQDTIPCLFLNIFQRWSWSICRPSVNWSSYKQKWKLSLFYSVLTALRTAWSASNLLIILSNKNNNFKILKRNRGLALPKMSYHTNTALSARWRNISVLRRTNRSSTGLLYFLIRLVKHLPVLVMSLETN